jgi:hypothetical protein
MWKKMRTETVTFSAYLFVLLSFVCLGVFVAALATSSSLAVGAGLALALCLAVAVTGFRFGARKLDEATPDNLGSPSIWASPLSADQIDRYRLSYRGTTEGEQRPRTRSLTVVAANIGDDRRLADDHRAAAPNRTAA